MTSPTDVSEFFITTFLFLLMQQKVNRFLIEGLVPNHLAAELAVSLIELKYPKESALWVSAQVSTIEDALDLLQQECELCADKHPMNQMITMLECEHQCCKECAKNYFTIQVRYLLNLRRPFRPLRNCLLIR